MSGAVLLAFGAMFGWGLTDFLIQRTIKKIGWLETLWWIYLASFIFLLPFIIKSLPTLTIENFGWLFLLGLVGLLSAIAHFQALKIGKLSVVETIIAFELPLTILLGVIFLSNSLSVLQIILIGLIFAGIILISIDFTRLKERHWLLCYFLKKRPILEKGAILAVITALFLALTNFLTAVNAVQTDALLVLWLSWSCGGLVFLSYLVFKNKLGQVARSGRENWRLILIMVIVDIASWLCFIYSLSDGGELAVITSITQSYVVVAMLLGLKFNKEKIRPWQYAGASLAIIGSLLIGLLDK